MISNSRNIGKELCQIFKLDPKKVTSISLTFRPEDLVYVDVTMLAFEKEVNSTVEIIKQFTLVETDKVNELILTSEHKLTFEQ